MGLSLRDRLTEQYIAPCEGGEVFLYKVGGLSMSVCAPSELTGKQVAAAVEKHYPCGTDCGWVIASDETFNDATPHPCQCEETPDRKHWLLYA